MLLQKHTNKSSYQPSILLFSQARPALVSHNRPTFLRPRRLQPQVGGRRGAAADRGLSTGVRRLGVVSLLPGQSGAPEGESAITSHCIVPTTCGKSTLNE